MTLSKAEQRELSKQISEGPTKQEESERATIKVGYGDTEYKFTEAIRRYFPSPAKPKVVIVWSGLANTSSTFLYNDINYLLVNSNGEQKSP